MLRAGAEMVEAHDPNAITTVQEGSAREREARNHWFLVVRDFGKDAKTPPRRPPKSSIPKSCEASDGAPKRPGIVDF